MEEGIRNVNQGLLGEMGAPLPHYVNDKTVQLKLVSPRAGVKLLGQRLHQSKCVKRDEESPSVFAQDRVAWLFEYQHVKTLDASDDLAQVTRIDRLTDMVEGRFQVVDR